MSIIIALIPAIIWGCTPLWTYLCGGKPIQQLLGTTYGALVIGIVIYLIKRPLISVSDFWWCFLAGIGWSLGQLASYIAFKRLSVSTTAPIVAGSQLIFVNLIGVLYFGSWASPLAKIIGTIATIIVIIGVTITARGNDNNQSTTDKKDFLKNVILLITGVGIGYTACSTLPKISGTSGWATFPPQSVGMLVSAIIFALIILKHPLNVFVNHKTFKNVITGFNSGLGTFSYLTSIMINGVSTGFTLSQMNTAVSAILGLLIMHEHKHGKALTATMIGVILVIIGGCLTGIIK